MTYRFALSDMSGSEPTSFWFSGNKWCAWGWGMAGWAIFITIAIKRYCRISYGAWVHLHITRIYLCMLAMVLYVVILAIFAMWLYTVVGTLRASGSASTSDRSVIQIHVGACFLPILGPTSSDQPWQYTLRPQIWKTITSTSDHGIV